MEGRKKDVVKYSGGLLGLEPESDATGLYFLVVLLLEALLIIDMVAFGGVRKKKKLGRDGKENSLFEKSIVENLMKIEWKYKWRLCC